MENPTSGEKDVQKVYFKVDEPAYCQRFTGLMILAGDDTGLLLI